MNKPILQRKEDHIRINIEEDVSSGLRTGLEKIVLEHQALPEIDFFQMDTHVEFFNKILNVPLVISAMTGGSDESKEINRRLAIVAQSKGLAMGVGSQRIGLESPESMLSFEVRKYAPDILLFSNLGAVQLNYGLKVEDCQKAVDAIQADALALHLNPLQEAVQPEGDKNFSNILKSIEKVCNKIDVPVIVKEVGWGISQRTAKLLISAGVQAIDIAGAGGTSWSEVEKFRAKDNFQRDVAGAFKNWGITTLESIRNVQKIDQHFPLIASGGLRNGVDIAKCLALGASLCGMAGNFIKAAVLSEEELMLSVKTIIEQLKVAMFACGACSIEGLGKIKVIEKN